MIVWSLHSRKYVSAETQGYLLYTHDLAGSLVDEVLKTLEIFYFAKKNNSWLTWTSVQGFIRQNGWKVPVIFSWDALKDFLGLMVPRFLLINSCLLLKTFLPLCLGLKMIHYNRLVFSPWATVPRIGQQISHFASWVLNCTHLWSPKQNTIFFFLLEGTETSSMHRTRLLGKRRVDVSKSYGLI